MNGGCETPNATVYNRITKAMSKTPSPLEQACQNCAVSASPTIFKTPGKYSHSCNSPAPKYRTPTTMTTPRRCRTPSGPLYNPFEDHVDNLHLPTFSPNVFSKITSTPSSSQKTPAKSFRWSIDQQAVLYPADIDEMPLHQDALMSRNHDEHAEEQKQQAIDTFFSSNYIVPSPWTNNVPTSKIAREAEKDKSRSSKDSSSLESSKSSINSQCVSKKDSACQTTLTLPVGFDLQKILADYFTYSQQNDSVEMLSTSTLRRKLFCQGDQPTSMRTSSTGRRFPEVGEKNMTVDGSPPVSPLRYTTPCRHRSPIETPGSTQFSSSPIRNVTRSSTSTRPERLSSPELSPISTPVSRKCSPGAERQLQFTPSSGNPSIVLSSPDISPIKFEQSFGYEPLIASPDFLEDFDDECVQAAAPAEEHQEADVHHRRETVDMCFEAPEMLGCSQNMEMDMSTSQSHAAMLEQEPRLGNWGLSIIKECSDFERTNLENGSSMACGTSNQDTGYQTASLQLTNQDTGLLHTNLTQQLNSLPLCSNNDMTCENDAASKIVDDSGILASTSYRGVMEIKENMYESGFTVSNLQSKPKRGNLFENVGPSVFPCSKEHKPILFSDNQPEQLEECQTLPKMVPSGWHGVPVFSWGPSPSEQSSM